VAGDIPTEDITGEIVLDRRMFYPRTPEVARARLARRVALRSHRPISHGRTGERGFVAAEMETKDAARTISGSNGKLQRNRGTMCVLINFVIRCFEAS
jgi:hypothetical protein